MSQTMPKQILLIVDDDESIRSQMRWALKEYELLEAEDRPSALEIIRTRHPKVVMLDLGLPPKPREAEEGLAALREILAFDPAVKVILVSGNTEKENALKAISLGAFDFFSKPPVMEEVRIVIDRAFRMTRLEEENRKLLRHRKEAAGLEGLLGNSPAMQEVFQMIRKVATVDVPVLILGESGTGKELAAKAIHRMSLRKDGPFVVINCGAIPETLLESELFGHEKGAFTGAESRRKGRIEYAHGGTLFLDEIGELSPPLQAKLLRFLQEYTIERVGGREEIQVDVRVLAATNRDLRRGVGNGTFREDLFFRLSVVTCTMPPLRDRGDDLFLLAKAFLRQYTAEFRKPIKGFQSEVLDILPVYPWPGNVREVENRIKRAVIMAGGEWLTLADLSFENQEQKKAKLPGRLREARDAVEKQMIHHALEKNNGVVLQAAKELGISRQALTDLIKKHGIFIR